MRPTKTPQVRVAAGKTARLPRAAPAPRAVPLHFQAFTQLRDATFRGDYPERTQLPGELALDEQFGVSRIMVRRALDEVASRGLSWRTQYHGTCSRAC